MSHIDHKERDAKKVEQMFSTIAARYDLLNHVLSLGLDMGWRRKLPGRHEKLIVAESLTSVQDRGYGD